MLEGIKEPTQTQYVFSCPMHGAESQVFCFRAFTEENKHLWQKYTAALNKVGFEPGELERLLAKR